MRSTVPLRHRLVFFARSGLLVVLVGCAGQTRRTAPLAPDQGELPKRFVLVKKSGERVPFDQARVSGDSVIGLLRNGERFSVPRDSVALESRVKTREALGVTAVALALLVGGSFALLVTAVFR